MEVSNKSWGYPQVTNFRIFHYKPTIVGYPIYGNLQHQCQVHVAEWVEGEKLSQSQAAVIRSLHSHHLDFHHGVPYYTSFSMSLDEYLTL